MATSKSYYARPNYRFLSSTEHHHHHFTNDSSSFELDESDLYNNSVSTLSNSPEFRAKPMSSSSRLGKTRPTAAANNNNNSIKRSDLSASLPVNIPDWSKILGDEYRENRRRDSDYDDDVEGGDDGFFFEGGTRVPPHEFLARTRMASFSVHEGLGRTLKGRDLSKVRNAIWAKTGFQD